MAADRARPRPRWTSRREVRRSRFSPPVVHRRPSAGASERFARFMGTASFLVYMTAFVALWMHLERRGRGRTRFDLYPFIFLTLMLSLQASYAAPLILLAQNRQADRDRVALEQDRARDERNLADTEYLTREVAVAAHRPARGRDPRLRPLRAAQPAGRGGGARRQRARARRAGTTESRPSDRPAAPEPASARGTEGRRAT